MSRCLAPGHVRNRPAAPPHAAPAPGSLPHRFLAWGIFRVTPSVHIAPVIECRNGFTYNAIDAYRNSDAHKEIVRHARGLKGSKAEVKLYELVT